LTLQKYASPERALHFSDLNTAHFQAGPGSNWSVGKWDGRCKDRLQRCRKGFN